MKTVDEIVAALEELNKHEIDIQQSGFTRDYKEAQYALIEAKREALEFVLDYKRHIL